MRTFLTILCLIVSARAEVVTAIDPFGEMPRGKTVVWSPLFQASWDAMNKELGGKPVKVYPPNELMARLDSFEWDADKVMPVGKWKVWSGRATEDFLETVNREAAAMTGEPKGPFTLANEHPGGLAFFGLLDREVEFLSPFFKSVKLPMEFGEEKSEVEFFGTKGDFSNQYGEAVKVLAHRPVDGSHALEVSCKGGDDKVIFYRPPAGQDFATACKWLREWRKAFEWNAELPGTWNDRLLHKNDEVRVPYVSLDLKEDFTDKLAGGRFHEKAGAPWRIARAEQVTKFKLHEKGARVRVETSMEAEPFGSMSDDSVPRRFFYDRPFFVFLWRDGAEWPYFGAWIGDASALRKF